MWFDNGHCFETKERKREGFCKQTLRFLQFVLMILPAGSPTERWNTIPVYWLIVFLDQMFLHLASICPTISYARTETSLLPFSLWTASSIWNRARLGCESVNVLEMRPEKDQTLPSCWRASSRSPQFGNIAGWCCLNQESTSFMLHLGWSVKLCKASVGWVLPCYDFYFL